MEKDQPVVLNLKGLLTQVLNSGKYKGMLEPGNLDLANRPQVINPDGSVSTVRSMSVDFDGKTYLLPTVIGNKIVSDDEAIKHFQDTGEHLGVFDNPDNATNYAKLLHYQQDLAYTNNDITQALDTLIGVISGAKK